MIYVFHTSDLIYQVTLIILIYMKVKSRELPDKVRVEILDTLYTTAGAVRGRDSMKLFLRDLLTPSERIMLGRRIMIARKLLAGKTHREIEAEMKVGKDTVWRVQRWLLDQMQGFEHAVAKLEQELDNRHFKNRYGRPSILKFLKK